MLRHYYTLSRLCGEFQLLIGCKLIECFSQEKNNLVLGFFDGAGVKYLQFSTDTALGCIYLRFNFNRAGSNSVDLMPELAGDVLQDIELLPNDRIIRFKFINHELYAFLFGGSRNNMLLTDNEGKILDAFKNSDELDSTHLSVDITRLQSLREFKDTTIIKALTNCSLLLGKYYAGELCLRLKLNKEQPIESFSNEELNKIEDAAIRLREQCLKSRRFYILKMAAGEPLLSLIPLQAFPEVIREFDSISHAVQYKIVTILKDKSFYNAYHFLYKRLKRTEEKLKENLKHIGNPEKSIERSELFRHWGELLLNVTDKKQKGLKSIDATDWDGTNHKIPLSEKLNIHENSNYYFERAKDARENIKHREKQIPKLKANIKIIENALNELDTAKSFKEIEKIRQSLNKTTGINMAENTQEKESKFRIFDLGEGYVLYVGKNAANNDELTMKFAKPNDIWMHARGSSGSHVVLKMPDNEKPPRRILQKAAAIAAYYSQSKNAKYVPVSYTFKKYVRKPKGANPGSVVIAREEVIMVEPKLPEE